MNRVSVFRGPEAGRDGYSISQNGVGPDHHERRVGLIEEDAPFQW
jgi:hypothetical protein